MALNYVAKFSADTSQHDAALKKSAKQVYNYKKNVESAKGVLSKFGKAVPQIAAVLGVTTGAMATFNKLVNQTQSSTDTWGRTLKIVDGTINSLANRLSGVGFGNFIDGLKKSAQAARDAYNELDQLGTMTIFQDKATADYNYQKAQYERIIKDKNSSKTQVKEAQAGLKKLRENYIKGQEALAAQAIKTYKAQMQQIFADAGVTVDQGFIEKYLGSQEGYDKAAKDYNALVAKMERNRTWVDTYDFNTGMKNGGYWKDDNTEADKKRKTALFAVMQASDEKLKEANAHYINARNIQTAIIQDEIQQNRMNQAASSRYEKQDKTTQTANTDEEKLTLLEELNKKLKELNVQKENLFSMDDNGNIIFDTTELKNVNKQIEEITNSIIYLKGQIYGNNDSYNIPSSGLISDPQEYYQNLDTWYETVKEASEYNPFEGMYSGMRTITNSINDLINVWSSWKNLLENDDATFADYFSTITSTIFTTIDSVSTLVETIQLLNAIVTASKAAQTIVESAKAAASLAEMAAAVTAFYAPLGPAGIAPAAATIAAYKAVAEIGAFADGGIVSGGLVNGDKNIVAVNGAEMILNGTQQAQLFRMLNGIGINTSYNPNNNVIFRISGSDLVGTIDNYNRKTNKVR